MQFVSKFHLTQGTAAAFADQLRGVAFAADMSQQQQPGTFIDEIGQQLTAFTVSEVTANPEYPPFEFKTAVGIHQHFPVIVAFKDESITTAQFPADMFRSMTEVRGNADTHIAAADLKTHRIDRIMGQ